MSDDEYCELDAVYYKEVAKKVRVYLDANQYANFMEIFRANVNDVDKYVAKSYCKKIENDPLSYAKLFMID